MADLPDVILLTEGQTHPLFKLESRVAGVFQQRMSILGESILSSVFIRSADPSMSVEVKYFDTTTGEQALGERFDLPSHVALTTADVGVTKRILVGRIHNKPVCEVTVLGAGSIEFGVYASVRSEVALDLDLFLDGQDADLTEDTGQGVMCYDETQDKFFFIRCTGGALSFSLSAVNAREFGSAAIAFGVTSTLITHTPAAPQKLVRVLVGGDGYAEFTVKINGTTWAIIRNSWNDRSPSLDFDGKALSDSDTITVEAKNVSLGQGVCDYEAFVYLGDG